MTLFEVGQGAGAILTIITLSVLIIKWLVVRPIKNYIDVATYPISPNANGGESLGDIARTLQRFERKQIEMDYRLVVIEKLVKTQFNTPDNYHKP